MESYRDFVKRILPPVVVDGIKRFAYKGIRLSGDYTSWEQATDTSTGYDQPQILKKTKEALLKVKDGAAVYERDSVLFDKIEYSYPVLAGLMWVAAQHNGRLNVLDFGGSLGSTYYQNRIFLQNLSEVQWNIVEQSDHVTVGREYFENNFLRFYKTIEDCLSVTTPNVILISGVLQYLDKPYEYLTKLMDQPIDYIIIDRTPFWSGVEDRLCIQTVPSEIYKASYPIWIFSELRFIEFISKYPNPFEMVTEFQSLDNLKSPVPTVWKGMILRRKA